MEYTEVDCQVQPGGENIGILIAYLADIGYSMFEETGSGVKAYIETTLFSQQRLDEIPAQFSNTRAALQFTVSRIPDTNWNEQWESNFSPVRIDDRVYVRAEYHPVADKGVMYELVIHPRMAFGTGHHATTWLMMKAMLDLEMNQKHVLDMGCGTGILAILARKMGARAVVAIDNDANAVENTMQNRDQNHVPDVEVLQGDATTPGNRKFDFILANINRNIILDDLSLYIQNLSSQGYLVTSGYYFEDLESITLYAHSLGLVLHDHETSDRWCRATFKFK